MASQADKGLLMGLHRETGRWLALGAVPDADEALYQLNERIRDKWIRTRLTPDLIVILGDFSAFRVDRFPSQQVE